MSDELSLFDERMRRPAAVALVGGMALGFLAIFIQRVEGRMYPWALAIPFGLLAAAFLYGVSYRNLSKIYEES